MDFSDLSDYTELQKQSFLEDLKSKFKAVEDKNTELMTELNGLPPDTKIGSVNKEAIIQGIKNVIASVAEFGDNTTTYHFENQNGQAVNITVNNNQSNISFETFGGKPTAFREALTPISNNANELKTAARGVEPERQPAIEQAARKLNRLVERFEYLASIFETRQYREFVIAVDNPVQLANAVVAAKTEADNAKLIADAASTLASDLQNETERARLDTREKKGNLDRAKEALDQTPGDARLGNAVAAAQQEWEAAVEDFERSAAASTAAKDRAETVKEEARAAAATAAELSGPRFLAYFDEFPKIVHAQAYLHGKLVAEASARNILEKATLATMDPKDAAYRLFSYLSKRDQSFTSGGPAQSVMDQLNRILQNEGIEGAQTGLVTSLLRGGILEKSMLPATAVLKTKNEEDADAVGMAFNPDKATAEFERDIAHGTVTPESVVTQKQELAYGVLSCMLGTHTSKEDLVYSVTSPNPYQFEKDQFAYGCILFSGKLSGYMTVEITEKTAGITKEEVDAVEAIQRNGQIPMKNLAIVEQVERSIQEVRANPDISTIARVERARDIDLGYIPPTIDYGTSSTAPTFGTGTNVTLLSDCAFICARILNEMKEADYFVRSDLTSGKQSTADDSRMKKIPYSLKYEAMSDPTASDIVTLGSAVKLAIDTQYVGHCSVRAGDLGRIFFATLVLEDKISEIKDLATNTSPRYYSLKNETFEEYLDAKQIAADNAEQEARARRILETTDPTDAGAVDAAVRNVEFTTELARQSETDATLKLHETTMALFYHKIWSRELGSSAVAQGGAKLEESHMIIPFLVRAVSDSNRVVPTLCAFDDWIGPTEQFFRIEQTCIMEIENYSTSRPSVKYARGGQQRIINDVAAWIKERDTSLPLTFAEIFTKLEPDKRIIEHATTCCAMLMEAVHAHTVYTDDARKGGLARQRASETSVRTLAERVATIKMGTI